MNTLSFLHKARLSQARALLFPKVLLPLGIKNLIMTKVHFRSYIHKKMILFPQRIDRDIAEDDPVRLLDALVDNLMLDNVYKLYKPSGRKPYHPQMMLKVILYAYMNNIYSCRRIESLLKRDIHFIYLAGYEQPDSLPSIVFVIV